jgi:hypothetical protein
MADTPYWFLSRFSVPPLQLLNISFFAFTRTAPADSQIWDVLLYLLRSYSFLYWTYRRSYRSYRCLHAIEEEYLVLKFAAK